jgi:hypothetical protein
LSKEATFNDPVKLKDCCKEWEKRHPEGMADYFLIK